MPTFTYPGVYIEELPSGVHTITGVATSIAAFVGWAPKGPVDVATLVESWTDFQSQFGGLDSRGYLGYAMNQFFANGGQQAYIVRVVWDGSLPPASGNPTPSATARATGVGVGATTITATTGSVSGTANLLVTSATLQSIAVTPANANIAKGQKQPFSAIGSFSDGSTLDLTNNVAWASATPAAATIDPKTGIATGAGPGTSVISATLGAAPPGTAPLTVTAPVVVSIAVSAADPRWIGNGQTKQYVATGTFSDGTLQDVTATATWASTNLSVATVGPGGLATATGLGTTTITATSGGAVGSAPLKVTAATLGAVSVSPMNPTLVTGQTQQFTATGRYSDQTTQDLTASVTWTSGTPATATISPSGLAKVVGAAAQTSVVTATPTFGGPPVTSTITVSGATLTSIAVTPANPTIAKGQTLPLTAVGTYSDNTTHDVTVTAAWTAATPAVATVGASTGLATGAGVGTSAISAALGGQTGTVTLTVTGPALQSLSVTAPSPPWIATGQTKQYVATGSYSDGTTQNLSTSATWASSYPTTASVSSTGLATAVGGGGTLTLFARDPGAWGNRLQVKITLQSSDSTRFTVQVLQSQQVLNTTVVQVVESFPSLSASASDPKYVVTVINADSQLVTFLDPVTKSSTPPSATPASTPVAVPLSGGADGTPLEPNDGNFEVAIGSDPAANFAYGVHLLDRVSIFNLLCVPGEADEPTIQNLQEYCYNQRAFYLVDAPELATTSNLRSTGPVGRQGNRGNLTGTYAINSAFYYPWIDAPDPLFGNRSTPFPPCGFVAGIYARTDASRGVWKAPAGIDASLTGLFGLEFNLTDQENGDLNVQAINCLRDFRVYGNVVWGARTLRGSDEAGSEWKYVPIRRFALFLESSLYNGTQWVVFEPNDERLWGQIRLNVGAFMQGLFLQGAFQGTTPAQAYFVKCDRDNNPQSSINQGIVNILVGFAPVYPAEFVVIQIQQIQQLAGQSAT